MFAPINYQPIDLQQRAFSRMLLQFRDSPVLLSLLWGFVSELQNLSDAIAGVINGRDPSKATGYNMDAIGRIVGQPRVILTASGTDWFVPDTNGQGADQGKAWVLNAPEGATSLANDGATRSMIEAKIEKNFVNYGSAPEISAMILKAFGMRSSIITSAAGQVNIYIENSASTTTINALSTYKTDNTVDNAYLLPIAAGVSINNVITAVVI